jgi:hypothetical protein
VLRRLVASGAESIFVETDTYRNTARGLYESMGFPFRSYPMLKIVLKQAMPNCGIILPLSRKTIV